MPTRPKAASKARKSGMIHFLDLGHEYGERISDLSDPDGAANPAMRERRLKRRFVGIDPEMKAGLPKRPNVRWVEGKAQDELKKIPDSSVRVVNSDFFVPSLVGEEQIDTTFACLPEIKRVLVKNGRFYATVPKRDEEITRKVLEHFGFEVRHRPITGEEVKTTGIAMWAGAVYKYGFEQAAPIRFVAIKRG